MNQSCSEANRINSQEESNRVQRWIDSTQLHLPLPRLSTTVEASACLLLMFTQITTPNIQHLDHKAYKAFRIEINL